MSKNNFYINKSNGVDGYNPYCKTCTKQKSSKWVKEHAEVHRAYKRTERAKQVCRPTKRKNDQKYRNGETYQKWHESNKSKLKEYREKRKHKKHDISETEWMECKIYFHNCCAYCGLPESEHYKRWKKEYRKSDLHKEHVDDNGANDLSNCVPACLNCNSSKWNHDFETWYRKQSFFSKEKLIRIQRWLDCDHKLHLRKGELHNGK